MEKPKQPPLDERELRKIWESAQRYPYPICGEVVVEERGEAPLRSAVKFKHIKLVYSSCVPVFDAEGNLLDVKTEFRIYKAWKEEAQTPFLIIDRDGYINPKKLEYSVKRVDGVDEEILKQINEIVKEDGGSIILEPLPRLKDANSLKDLDWLNLISEIIDYKSVGVDPDFKVVRLATLPRGVHPSINPHAQIVLPGQTGKSEYYNAIGTLEDKVSDNSLIGYADSDGPKPGSLDKTDLPIAFDQVESLARGNILRYLANIMERGEALIDNAASPFSIWSRSTLIFLSNPIGEAKSQYPIFLEKLCRNPTFGRRFGIILYKTDAKRINSREKDLKAELADKVALYRAVEEYALPEIRKIVYSEQIWRWLNERNEEWVKQALSLLETLPAESEGLALFLKEFILNGGTHTRGAALNCAIAKNLNKIALKDYSVEDLLRDAEEYLAEVLKINFESIQTITQNYREGRDDLTRRTFDTLPTYLKEVVSAVELWRRNLKGEDREKIPIPYKLRLDEIPYTPQTERYFSRIINFARKGNPSRHNSDLQTQMCIEVEKDDSGIYAILWSLAPNQAIKPLGVFGISENSEFSKALGEGSKQRDNPSDKAGASAKLFEISETSEIPKNLKPTNLVKHLTTHHQIPEGTKANTQHKQSSLTTFRCVECSCVFLSQTDLQRHIESNHRSDPKDQRSERERILDTISKLENIDLEG